MSNEPLNGDFTILYNKNSEEPRNKFVMKYVDNTLIDGPIIIINDKKDLEITAHKTLAEKAFKKVKWIGYTID